METYGYIDSGDSSCDISNNSTSQFVHLILLDDIVELL